MLRGAAVAGGLLTATGLLNRIPVPVYAATEYDVVVVGSGAAGMTAALRAAKRGLSVVVLEKAPTFGGSAARSGAGIWIPNNEVILAAGVPDTPALAAAYLASVVGSEVPAARQNAFLLNGPPMISFVVNNSPLRFRWMEGYSDYYPERSGGMPNGRSIEPAILDGHVLGAELANLNPAYIPTPDGVVVFSADYRWLNIAAVNARGTAVSLETVARWVAATAAGQKPLTMGQSLAGGLRAGLQSAGVPVLRNTPLVDLAVESGRVTGVVATQNGTNTTIRARRASLSVPAGSSATRACGRSSNSSRSVRAGPSAPRRTPETVSRRGRMWAPRSR